VLFRSFVNGRPTSAAILNHSLREAYHTLIPQGRNPVVFVFIELDPGQVDVNVHPAKKEVRFREPGGLRDALIDSLRSALSKGSAVSSSSSVPGQEEGEGEERQEHFKIEDLPEIKAFRYPGVSSKSDFYGKLPEIEPDKLEGATGRRDETFQRRSPWSWCRVLGQLAELYVVLETDDGYVIMDPHAAHERVLFEKFMRRCLQKKIEVQNMLIPDTVELVPRDAASVRRQLASFREMGFGISEFGTNAFVVDAVPSGFEDMNLKDFLVQALADLESAGARRSKGRWREESIAQAACKTAVKARDKLSLEEVEKLVIELANTEMPYTCPHGRPTLIYTPIREIDRRFGRE